MTVPNTFMLMINVRPEVAGATSSFIVFFGSSVSLTQYALAGDIVLSYAATLMCVSVVGALVGIYGISRLMKHFKRSSILVYMNIMILVTATILIPLYGILNFSETTEELGLSSPC